MTPGLPPRVSEVLRRSLPALLLASIVLVPFLGKPFTMDDTVFLFEARHAIGDPLHPTAFDMPWNGSVGRVSTMVPTGPGMAWLLVPSVLSSHPEVVAHLLQLAMLWLAIVATVALALRLGVASRWSAAAGLLVGLAPAVLGMAGTAMPDVPGMAIGVAGIQQLVAWRDDRRIRQAVAAALLLGLAPLVRTHLVGLFAIGALLLLGNPLEPARWRTGGAGRWAPLVAATIITALLTLVTRDPASGAGSIAGAAAAWSSPWRIPPNLLAYLVHWSIALPFTLPWVAIRFRAIVAHPWLFVPSVAAAAGIAIAAAPPDLTWLFVALGALTLTAMAEALLDAWRRRDGLQFTLVAWLLLPLPAAVYTHLPSKLLLVSAPAAAILVSRAASALAAVGRRTIAATALASALLGIAILRAETAFSTLGRDAAETLIRPQVAVGRRVWYVGSWGFQWYAERAGARFFPVEPPFPRNGDLVVACRICEPHIYPDAMRALLPARRISHADPGGRLMDMGVNAGFFSNTWGLLPWSWGRGLLEGFDVYVVRHPE